MAATVGVIPSRLQAWVAVLAFFALAFPAATQEIGAVSGLVVSSWDGTPLSATVITVRGTTLAARTDASGRYELQGVPPGDQVLRFSKSGFAAAVVTDVRVIPGQTTTVNGNLRPEFYDMEEFEVTAEEFSEQAMQIIEERKGATAMIEALGSEQISKLGAGDAAEALSKVTGASIADGKFAVIRGLADRYTSTTLNGTDVPSADPDRKAAQLDLFPSHFIGRLDVRKTFTPDLPGGFAGGAINIVTRDFPDERFLTLSAGTAYNTQASLRDDFPMSDRSSTDWLALDDGYRSLPDIARARNPRAEGTARPLGTDIRESFRSQQFAPTAGSSPLNSSFSMTLGDKVKLFNRPLGFVGGLSYKNDSNFYDDGEVIKYNVTPFGTEVFPKKDVRGVTESTWGALVGLGYEVSEHHKLGFNMIYVQTAEDEARRLVGQDQTLSTEPAVSYLDQSVLHWTERNLTYYQWKGEHTLPELKDIELDWAGSISSTSQEEPDHRIFSFFAQPGDPGDRTDDFYNAQSSSQPDKPTRFFRALQENNASLRGDLTIPIPSYNSKDNFFKTGVAGGRSQRDYLSRAFELRFDQSRSSFGHQGDPNDLDKNYQYHHFLGNFSYSGEQAIDAAYVMGDWAVFDWLRLVSGVRFETTDISVTGRNITTGQPFTAGIQQDDFLPAINTTFTIRSNLLVRAAWSQTVIRPTYRELGRVEVYDVGQGRTYIGNENLRMSSSQNFDVRLEYYPSQGAIFSVGAFAKKIDAPIEQRAKFNDNSVVDYTNFEKAGVQGLEFEARQNLGEWLSPLDQFTLGFNYAFIQSEVPLTKEQLGPNNRGSFSDRIVRPLYDQPEYVVNGDVTWEYRPTGTTVTLSGGAVGRRLVVVGLTTPDEFEEPAPQLDVFVSQKLSEGWKIKLSAKNLLNPIYERTVDWPNQPLVISHYTKGMTFGVSMSWDF